MTSYAPTIDNLEIEQGATFARQYPVSGVLMAGATVKAQARAAQSSTAALMVEFTTVLVPDGTDPMAGTVNVSLTPLQTWGITLASGFWDAVLTAADGTVARIARGTVDLSAGVTAP